VPLNQPLITEYLHFTRHIYIHYGILWMCAAVLTYEMLLRVSVFISVITRVSSAETNV
jgi:hypothetical protein